MLCHGEPWCWGAEEVLRGAGGEGRSVPLESRLASLTSPGRGQGQRRALYQQLPRCERGTVAVQAEQALGVL